MMKKLAPTIVMLGCLAAPAIGQTAEPTQISAKSGQEVKAGWIGSVGADCKPDPAPTLTPAKLADHGQIKLQQAEVQTNSFPACPGAKLPVIVVFYTSSPGFKGTDGFTLTAAGGMTHSYSITVE